MLSGKDEVKEVEGINHNFSLKFMLAVILNFRSTLLTVCRIRLKNFNFK